MSKISEYHFDAPDLSEAESGVRDSWGGRALTQTGHWR